ncbi:hypothetical protein CC79DRAFT_908010 [Sarocladium strictum]
MPATTRRAEGAWRYEPPYVPPEEATTGEGNPFEKKVLGSCHCEMVQFYVTRDKPLKAKFCHCSDCQIIHGAPFQWAAIVHKSDIAFIKGTDNLNFLNSGTDKPTHELPCKVRCSNCGSLLMDEGRNMCLLFPTVLRMDRAELTKNFYPDMHIFYEQRVVDIPDGKPKWAGLDEKSEQLDLH